MVNGLGIWRFYGQFFGNGYQGGNHIVGTRYGLVGRNGIELLQQPVMSLTEYLVLDVAQSAVLQYLVSLLQHASELRNRSALHGLRCLLQL